MLNVKPYLRMKFTWKEQWPFIRKVVIYNAHIVNAMSNMARSKGMWSKRYCILYMLYMIFCILYYDSSSLHQFYIFCYLKTNAAYHCCHQWSLRETLNLVRRKFYRLFKFLLPVPYTLALCLPSRVHFEVKRITFFITLWLGKSIHFVSDLGQFSR